MVGRDKTRELVTSFFYECFNFWTRESKEVGEAKKLAFRDCEKLQHDPYVPVGDKLDLAAKEEALNDLRRFELKE